VLDIGEPDRGSADVGDLPIPVRGVGIVVERDAVGLRCGSGVGAELLEEIVPMPTRPMPTRPNATISPW